ncbi:1,3-beta-glucanosyltransferase gel2 [Seminavis robusta]|uniref:1,3-beta-glucanosyltransferase gel2 n=1 Tax=Seminavis robusta TaxID=568900 RepID=A0A9N8EWR6_9STRA|nr:1,3-beta-glucanosyltransferase gel2 [Seminavis robusta]|eukprot:Sro2166_g317310.1 1,3-beta-glucanosyltransferase gel2 (326) ;mRNA; r:16479-17643
MLTEFGCISKSFPNVSGTDGQIYKGQRTVDQARWLLEEKELRDQFAGGFAFEYSIEMQNAIGDSPYPFAQWGAQNYGIGYLSPEDCDDVDIPCQYNPEPSFDYLQAAYRNSTVLDPTNIRNFSIPETRQSRTTCPSQFPPISSFKWRSDRVRNLKCPASGSSSSFQCPANLNDLRVHQSDRGQSGWVVFLESILFLTVSFVVYSWLMSFVDKMSEYQEERERDQPRWIKVVMPSVSTKDTDGDSSDESAGLLSMKGWNYYKSTVRYQSVDSDMKEERAFNRYRGGQSFDSEPNQPSIIESDLSDDSYQDGACEDGGQNWQGAQDA